MVTTALRSFKMCPWNLNKAELSELSFISEIVCLVVFGIYDCWSLLASTVDSSILIHAPDTRRTILQDTYHISSDWTKQTQPTIQISLDFSVNVEND